MIPMDASGAFIPMAFYPTGGSHGLGNDVDVSPPIKVGSGLGIGSGPAIAHIPFDMTQVTSDVNRQRLAAGSPVRTLHAAGGAHVITAFAQNQREEVRDLGDTAVALNAEPGTHQQTYVAIRTANTNANGHGIAEDVAHTLDGANGQAIAFSGKDYGADAGDISPTLRAMGHDTSWANGGGQVAVATYWDGGQTSDTLDVSSLVKGQMMPEKRRFPALLEAMQVRRLSPKECQRLQGFPDDHLDLDPPLSDSAKYRLCGNAVAVPVVSWIMQRIAAQEECT